MWGLRPPKRKKKKKDASVCMRRSRHLGTARESRAVLHPRASRQPRRRQRLTRYEPSVHALRALPPGSRGGKRSKTENDATLMRRVERSHCSSEPREFQRKRASHCYYPLPASATHHPLRRSLLGILTAAGPRFSLLFSAPSCFKKHFAAD